MKQKDIYEKIVELYGKDIDEGRIFLFENIGLLMRKNPLLYHQWDTCTKDDILSESYLIADNILTKQDIDNQKKISRLRFLFNKGGGHLYRYLTQYWNENYNIDDNEGNLLYDIQEDILDYILVTNGVISPLESKLLSCMKQGKGKYEIARAFNTTYYNIKNMIEILTIKIKRFLEDNNLNE